MKRILPLLAACILSGASCFAASRFWIGPSNGNWNNPANWSAESEGAPGASVPGAGDDVIFDMDAIVLMDGSSSVQSLSVSLLRNVTLYTGTPVSITISGSLSLAPGSVLKDSTSQPVAFPIVFNPATKATASIQGFWIFAGNNPANIISEDGANFIASASNRIKVLSSSFAGAESKIISRQFAGNIVAADSALEFGNATYFTVDGDLNPAIPNARWNNTSRLEIFGNVSSVTHGGAKPFYGMVTINLPSLTADARFNLPNGSEIKGLFSITNTNGHTLTILSATGASDQVQSIIRNSLVISGASTNVAMATGTPAAPFTFYQLAVSLDFLQSGGNFSLQDYNGFAGGSNLVIGRHLRQTAGTFITRSTANAGYVVDMDYNFGGIMNSDIEQQISMSSGSIDNAQHSVVLRLNSKTDYTGVTLQSPLSTGRVEFIRGAISTTATNILTINDADTSTAVRVGISNSYVNGPVRINTNSTHRYILPTGKSSTVMNAAYLLPVSSTPSVYQAEFFRNGYSDVTMIAVPLTGISKDKYWNINKISGDDAKVKLYLDALIEGSGTNDIFGVAHYTNNQWVSEISAPVFGNQIPAMVTSKDLTSYGPFTFGYINIGGGALPVNLVSFEAVKQNGGASINWKAEEVPARFDVQRSTDGKNFITLASVNGVVSKSLYTYFDERLPPGNIYYRLQSFEKDGSSSYSKIATIINKEAINSNVTLWPTMVATQSKFAITATRSGRLDLLVTDMSGRNVRQQQFALNAGHFETVLDLCSLKPGIYQLSSLVNGVASGTIRFVKN